MIVMPGSVVRRLGALALLAGLSLAPVPSSAVAVDPGDPIDLGGTEVATSTDERNPTALEAGLWRTELKAGESFAHEFSYTRTMRFSSVHISVTGTPANSTESIELKAFGLGETDCGTESQTADYAAPFSAIGVDLEIGPDGVTDLNSECVRADTIRFTVGPSGSTRDSTDDLPLTVKVVEESPLADADEAAENLPAPPESVPSFTAPAAGEDRGEVEGDRSFDGAPLLEEGTWSSSVTEGEQRIYRVHLEWGQALAARLDVEAWSESDLEVFGYSSPTVEMWAYNPMRRGLDSDFDGLTNSDTIGQDPLRLNYGLGPVRYLNRYDDQNAYLPGDYYVTVTVPDPGEREPETIPFTLTVEAQGDIEGVPDYAEAEPFLIGDGKRSQVASGNPAPAGTGESWFDTRHLSGVGLGAFGLLCLAFGTVLLRRRSA